jgi:hypothetical protein
MSRPHGHLVKAVQVLAPLMHSPANRAIRARIRSRTKLADFKRAEPWFRSNNVVGLIVGRKTSGPDRRRGDLCLKFLVRHKLPESRLSDEEMIPRVLKLESLRKEALTDVDVCLGIAAAHAVERVRPVSPGVSIGHSRAAGGTLGLVVKQGGQDYYLSCAHVRAPGSIGNAQIDDVIEQPADLFGELADNVIATLAKFSDVRRDSLDVAIAKANDIAHSAEVPGIGVPDGILPLEAADFTDSTLVVTRNGVGSGPQEGAIDGFGSVSLWYSDLGEQVTLNGVVIYDSHSEGGDSGAAVFVKGGRTVAGLHVGAVSNTQSVCFPIKRVFDKLGVTL